MRVTTASRKKAVVRHENHGVRIGGEVFLEPVPRVQVEMVRRLVEQQQRGAPEQQLGQRQPHLPSARERVGGLRELRVGEAEPAQHGGDFQIDAVAVFDAEAILQRAVAFEQRVVVGRRHGAVAETLLDAVHLGLHRQQLAERRAGFVENGVARVRQAVLRQIAHGQRVGLEDGAAVRLVEAGEHFQQRGLAGAVRAAEPRRARPQRSAR